MRQRWEIARAAGVRISVHACSGKKRGFYEPFGDASRFLGADTTYIHCNAFSDREWQLIAESGGTASLPSGTDFAAVARSRARANKVFLRGSTTRAVSGLPTLSAR